MTDPKQPSELSDKDLGDVAGGNSIDKIQGVNHPKLHVPGSIAQGDTLDNTLTEDNLP